MEKLDGTLTLVMNLLGVKNNQSLMIQVEYLSFVYEIYIISFAGIL